MIKPLSLALPSRICVINGGLFVSRGVGRHPKRIIESYEIIHVEQGELGIREEDQEFTVRAGESLLLFPHREHAGTLDYPPDLRFYWIHFALDMSCIATDDDNDDAETMTIRQHTMLDEPERLRWVLRRFLDDQEQMRLSTGIEEGYVQIMLGELARTRYGTENTPGCALAQQVDEILRTRFHEAISTGDIATEIRYSPDHIARIYRQVYGRTILQSLHHYRIEYAKRLLLQKHMNMNEVIRASGFHDPAQFRKLFKQQEHFTPGAYRRLFARTHINTE